MPPLPTCAAAVLPPMLGSLEPWEMSLELVVLWDLQGRVIEVNRAFARKFGHAVPMWPSRELTDLVSPADVEEWQRAGRRIQLPPFHISREFRWETAQGTRWLAWEETLLRGPQGQPLAIRSVGRDVTKGHLAEEHFRKLALAVDQSPVSIIITTPGGLVQYVNPRFTETTGYTLENIFDEEIPVLRLGHVSEASYRDFCTAVSAGKKWRGELFTHYKRGQPVWESVTVSPIRDHSGEVTHLLCLREDVTERKNLEDLLRQAQKMESVGTLAGGIAHDFNNIIAIIRGFTELSLTREVSDKDRERYLRAVHSATLRAAGLVSQIMTFSRKSDVSYRPVDITEHINELVRMLQETFPRNIEIKTELDETIPAFAVDPNQLQQVLINLCVNARDVLPDGGTISLRTRRVSGEKIAHFKLHPEQEYVCIEVEDTGCGMPPMVVERIFEPFFSTKKDSGGTGLGLAVVYGAVTNHHGALDVQSTVGKGTTFLVYLPLTTDAPHATRPTEVASGPFPGGDETILIVEDENGLTELMETLLCGVGYSVMLAKDGQEGLDLIRDLGKRFDCVVLDINMPRVSGIDVLKELRHLRPKTPVMVMSGNLTGDIIDELHDLGQELMIEKPFELEELGSQLRMLLDKRRV